MLMNVLEHLEHHFAVEAKPVIIKTDVAFHPNANVPSHALAAIISFVPFRTYQS